MTPTFNIDVAVGRVPLLGGKTAVITGVGNGIGRKAFSMFSDAGAEVCGFDLSERGIASLKEEYPDALLEVVDVTDADQVARFAAQARERFDAVDVLFNSAGVGTVADGPLLLDETPDWVWDKTVGVNLTGTFYASRAIIPAMTRGGSIINIASILALAGQGGVSAYHASKGGVLSLTRAMAVEYAPRAIRVNVVSPGYCDTAMVQDYMSKQDDKQQARAELEALHPIGRLGEPEEVAALALWLGSDASTFITGANISVDGGYTAV
ncbi:SDR family NAD(P)-dependent oxidoreductase [Microbacterium sp. RD1]|uniref:SDR family NAD(P)-dependent oxidoreductase n=1 Tax=Microbacterium sp. RD1 TaxID=3457313 RepID=UPI003FA5AA0F